MSSELEYIKLKVDWYKYAFSWILAMIVGAVTFARTIDVEHAFGSEVLSFLILSIVLLLMALIATLYAALTLIHRLEEPYKTKSRILNSLLWVPRGSKWEAILGFIADFCWGGGLTAFVLALVFHAAK